MQKERIYIYIDGNNFYNTVVKKYKLHFLSFEIEKFCDNITGKNRDKKGTRYYVGQIKQEKDNTKSVELYNSQQKILQKIKNENIYTVLGRIQKIGNNYKEKGVDVRIAIDLLEGAYEDRFDTAIVISSDGDLAPAFELVRRKGKRIESVMFDKNYSFSLQRQSDSFKVFNESDLQNFGTKHNIPS